MQVKISLIKDDEVIESEVLEKPEIETVEKLISALIAEAARKSCGPIWPFQIDVR